MLGAGDMMVSQDRHGLCSCEISSLLGVEERKRRLTVSSHVNEGVINVKISVTKEGSYLALSDWGMG